MKFAIFFSLLLGAIGIQCQFPSFTTSSNSLQNLIASKPNQFTLPAFPSGFSLPRFPANFSLPPFPTRFTLPADFTLASRPNQITLPAYLTGVVNFNTSSNGTKPYRPVLPLSFFNLPPIRNISFTRPPLSTVRPSSVRPFF
jgi:hypothetical protein